MIKMRIYGYDCILNDMVVNPERYKCECGNSVRLQFKKDHDEKYCSVKVIEFLDPNNIEFIV